MSDRSVSVSPERALVRPAEVVAAVEVVLGPGNRPYTIDGTKLTFNSDVTFETWQLATLELLEASHKVSFWVADALAFGEGCFGDKAKTLVRAGSWAYQTAANAASVARAVAPERRHSNLSFEHHAA